MAPSKQASAANTANFAKDEKVLCFHHDMLYEAKVLELRQKDESDKTSPWEYKIHYKGWKNTVGCVVFFGGRVGRRCLGRLVLVKFWVRMVSLR